MPVWDSPIRDPDTGAAGRSPSGSMKAGSDPSPTIPGRARQDSSTMAAWIWSMGWGVRGWWGLSWKGRGCWERGIGVTDFCRVQKYISIIELCPITYDPFMDKEGHILCDDDGIMNPSSPQPPPTLNLTPPPPPPHHSIQNPRPHSAPIT